MNYQEKIKYIEDYQFSDSFHYKMKELHNYSQYEINILIDGLKDYFLAHLINKNKEMIGMCSTHIDNAWHIFILHTREYFDFCEIVYGKYLHHEPGKKGELSKQDNTQMFINTIKYLKEIKKIRTYKSQDFNKLKELDEFYSMFLIEGLIENKLDFEKAFKQSNYTIKSLLHSNKGKL